MKESIQTWLNNKTCDLAVRVANEIAAAKKINDVVYYTNLEAEDLTQLPTNGLLYGTIYFAKDNIWTKGRTTTASSKILANFIPPENATVIDLLHNAGAALIGKTVLDELGMGGTGLHACTGPVYNPHDKTRIVGGSSSGSTFATALGIGSFALGTDTGDSIRKPASLVGIVGYKPTYGSISRYGVIPYAPSLDHVGFLTNHVSDLFYLAQATFQKDPKDFTSIDNAASYTTFLTKKPTGKKVGYFKVLEQFMPEALWKQYNTFFEAIKKQGYTVEALEFPKELLDAVAPIYMMISFAEAVSTHANLDGINFGLRVDGEDYEAVMRKTRAAGFGELVKKRFIIGSYQLKKENQQELLLKAKKVRRLIVKTLDEMYSKVDFIVMPPTVAPACHIADVVGKTMEDHVQDKAEFLDSILVLANFNGMPSVTIPFVEQDGMPIGINFNAQVKNDAELLMFSREMEAIVREMNGGTK